MIGLRDAVVIVTGGGGGIGAAISHRFASEGAKVIIFDVNIENAKKVAEEIKETGEYAKYISVDITNYEAVNTAVEQVYEDCGAIDILVNNAGWDHAAQFIDTTPELWEKIIKINLHGPINLHHAVLKKMVPCGRGRIVNISSDAGRVGSSGESVYSACKGGIISFSKTIARELARKKITVNVVCPGPTDTSLFREFAGDGEKGEKLRMALTKAIPFGRLGEPNDVAGAVCFLASEEAGFITGQVLSVSGGLTMAG